MKTTIDQHISDLLYYHECVVVPGFGAFLTRYFPAEIHAATSMMRPPSRRVAFNARINENDGLLAKHVARVEGVSYQEALEGIGISVRSWQRILRSGKKINLHGIGRLFFDESGLLQFNPAHDINYHIKSYGLNIFRATAMEREKQIKRSVNRAIENRGKSTSKSKTTSAKPGSSKNWVKWAAILGPVVAIVLVGSYMYTQERATFDNAAGYISNIFTADDQEESGEASIADSLSGGKANGTGPVSGDDNQNLSSSDNDQVLSGENADVDRGLYNVKDRPDEGDSDTKISDISDNAQPGTSPGSGSDKNESSENSFSNRDLNSDLSAVSQPDYQVIVGSFSKEENAQNYISALKGRGYDAYLAGKFGMYNRVAVGKFSSRSEAMNHLQEVRHQVNYKAWLNDN